MKKISIFTLAILVFHVGTFSQTLDEKLKEIDDYANTVANTWKGPGMAIAVVKDDKVVLAKGYGSRELGKNQPVNENTLFAIASNSKAFTTASIAILVDEKKMSWDDKVTKYLPDFKVFDPWVTNELTIRDLVTHRVGLDTFSGAYANIILPTAIVNTIIFLNIGDLHVLRGCQHYQLPTR